MQDRMVDKSKDKMRQIYLSSRLIHKLEDIYDYPLCVLEAPMGYGKTTAVMEFLKRSHANVLKLKVVEPSKSFFWQGFCKIISAVDIEKSALLQKMGFPDEKRMVYDAISILEDIHFPSMTVLFIDDYHILDCEYIDDFIECMVKSELEHLNVVITTRYIDLPNQEEFKLKGTLKHIVKEDLEFTVDEIVQYYHLCGITLAERDAKNLYTYTEGWISALYLLMLNDEGFTVMDKMEDIYKLIGKAIYEPFSESAKSFLLSMCIFNGFTVEQAEFMIANTKGNPLDLHIGILLEEVTRKNAFVSYDSDTKTYQMHHIFTNFLKDVVLKNENKKELYHRAGLWYLKCRTYHHAMHYFYLCEDYERLIQTIELDKSDSFNGDNKDLLITYMEACPNTLKSQYPMAMLVYAMHLFTYNRLDLFESVCGEITQIIETDLEMSDAKRRELQGEFELLISFTGYNDIRRMAEHHKAACNLLSKPTSIYDTNSRWTFGSFSVLYMFYRESGKLHQHVQDLIEVMPYYDRLTNGHGSGGEYLFQAERNFYIGDFENAEIYAHKASLKAQSKSETEMMLCAEFLLLRLSFMKGDLDQLKQRLSSMGKNSHYRSDYFYVHTIEICEGFIYGLLGQSKKIPERIAEGELSKSRLMFPAYALINMVYGRSLLISGEFLKLIGSVEEHLEIASVFPNLLAVIHIKIYHAAALDKIGRRGEAIALIKEALALAMPDHLIMPFVENGDFISSLLKRCQIEGVYIKEIDRILELYCVFEKTVKQINQLYFDVAKPKLSKREYEIAQLASEGYTNREISEKLYISQNTIKTQLKTIFEKLDINSRALLKKTL